MDCRRFVVVQFVAVAIDAQVLAGILVLGLRMRRSQKVRLIKGTPSRCLLYLHMVGYPRLGRSPMQYANEVGTGLGISQLPPFLNLPQAEVLLFQQLTDQGRLSWSSGLYLILGLVCHEATTVKDRLVGLREPGEDGGVFYVAGCG